MGLVEIKGERKGRLNRGGNRVKKEENAWQQSGEETGNIHVTSEQAEYHIFPIKSLVKDLFFSG